MKGELNFGHENFDEVSDECKNLIKALVEKDVDQRLNAEEALEHDWFKLNI